MQTMENYTYTNTANLQANYRTRRSKDEQDEKIVGQFLDTYFYPTFCTTITRNTDKDTQVKGLDVTVQGVDNVTYKIDEKAATRWAGRNLQTFAHEISSVNVNGRVYYGWLLNPDNINDYWVEVWIDGLNSIDGNLHDYTNITDATVSLIRKSDFFEYMKKNNISAEYLFNIGDWLRCNGMRSYKLNGFRITCQQPPIQERAANILIPRTTIINNISCLSVQIKNGKPIRLH